MLLDLSITFYFHYNICGCMCSTGSLQHRRLKWYIYSSCYYHQIGSIHLSHCYHIFSMVVCLRCLLHHILLLIAYTFREIREFVFIIIVQFKMSANSIAYTFREIREIVFIIIVQLMMSANSRIYSLAWRSYLFICTLHHLIIIIVQTYLKTLNL